MAPMPISTWGLNGLKREYLSHGTAINNTLRQVAGAIGSATIISIMTKATTQKAISSINAQIYGINKAFFSTGIILILSVLLALLFVGKKSNPNFLQSKDNQEDIA